MTPKEIAEDLYWTYYQKVADGSCPEYNAKECALIAVNAVINLIKNESNIIDTYNFYIKINAIKQEIEKL